MKRGTRLGPYEILEPLGKGGMGEVYRAHDPRLERDVAVKILPARLGDERQALERFEREAKVVASLSHPNIVAIHDVGEQDGTRFLVTELLPGKDLSRRLNEGPLPLERAVDIALQVARGLETIHRSGVVHQDLKPANIFLTDEDCAKIIDFGIARTLRLDDDAKTRGLVPEDVVGTLGYIAPEQLRGEPAQPGSDLFAFGAILYEMLVGRPAFHGSSAAETIAAILDRDPEPMDDAPGELADLVAACLHKDCARRPAGATEILRVLEAVEEGRSAAGDGAHLEQQIRFCTAVDGTTLAYATTGTGPPLVKAANWLNHLEFDWESPIWRHVISALAERHLLVRYDSRGNGLSDREPEKLAFDTFVDDLVTVVDATGLDRFALLGISQGCAVSIAYAVRNPDRVSHLILHGGYAVGWRLRGSKDDIERREALATLMTQGWGLENPAFRDVFTSLYIPGASDEQRRWFSELQRISASPEQARRLWDAIGTIDVRPLLEQVRCPTLVFHSRGDAAVPFEAGRQLASAIPGARFVPLESDNHLFLEHEPAWSRFVGEVRSFLAD